MTILSTRFKAACSALVAGVPGLGLFFALGAGGGELLGALGMPEYLAVCFPKYIASADKRVGVKEGSKIATFKRQPWARRLGTVVYGNAQGLSGSPIKRLVRKKRQWKSIDEFCEWWVATFREGERE
jgi:hypothetical protein